VAHGIGVRVAIVHGMPQVMTMELEGYGQSIIHLAWFRDDDTYHLVFGMVELRPAELPHDSGCSTKALRSGSKGRAYVYYQRFASSVGDAIAWYTNTMRDVLTFPDEQEPVQQKRLHGGPFVQEPPWPHLVTSNELVFAPDWMHGSRAHFLFPKNVLPAKIEHTVEGDKIREKLTEWLNFDVVHTYREYLGAICLVAPNPVFRAVEKSHLENARSNAAKSIAYKIVARHGHSVDGLRLEVVNERPRGRMVPMVHEFGKDPIVVFDSPAEVYSEGESIAHPDHGLFSWHEPLPVLRTVHVGMELPRRQKEVFVPAGGRKRPGYNYRVEEVDDAGEVVIGEPLTDQDIVSRLTATEARRARQQAAREHDQRWFHQAPADAAHYLRGLIGRAHDQVVIVDPYFDARGLLEFGHAKRRPAVSLHILTSARGLREGIDDSADKDRGSQLQRALEETFDTPSIRPEVRILRGKTPDVHDRFLVVDRNVWLSGNSLSTLGERAAMIVRLPDPEPVIERLEAFWRRAPSLADWLSNRRNTTAGD